MFSHLRSPSWAALWDEIAQVFMWEKSEIKVATGCCCEAWIKEKSVQPSIVKVLEMSYRV